MAIRLLKIFLLFLTLIMLSHTAAAQVEWTGVYFFDEDGGETVGGSKIYIAHTLTVYEKDGKLEARIYSQGFQTSRDLFADAVIDGPKLQLLFREKGPDQIFGDYEKGSLLMTLELKNGNLLTGWGSFKPTLESNGGKAGVRFKKIRDFEETWTSIENDEDNISFDFPTKYRTFEIEKTFEVTTAPGKLLDVARARIYAASISGAMLRFEHYETAGPTSLGRVIRETGSIAYGKASKIQHKSFEGLRFDRKKSSYSYESQYIAKPGRLFIMSCVSRSDAKQACARFFDSFNSSPAETSTSKGLEDLDLEKRSSVTHLPTQATKTKTSENRLRNAGLLIVNQARPFYTKEARKNEINGSIRIKATFSADGLVSDVKFIQTLRDGLNDSALFAIMRMVYLPEIRSGQAVAVRKIVVFKFTIY